MLVKILNGLISFLCNSLSWIFNLLPTSPFANLTYSDVSSALKNFTYFVPVSTMIQHFGLFLAILLMFYIYRIVLNWVKALGN